MEGVEEADGIDSVSFFVESLCFLLRVLLLFGRCRRNFIFGSLLYGFSQVSRPQCEENSSR